MQSYVKKENIKLCFIFDDNKSINRLNFFLFNDITNQTSSNPLC